MSEKIKSSYIKRASAYVRRDDVEKNERLGVRLGIDPEDRAMMRFIEGMGRNIHLNFQVDMATGVVTLIGVNGNYLSDVPIGRMDVNEADPK